MHLYRSVATTWHHSAAGRRTMPVANDREDIALDACAVIRRQPHSKLPVILNPEYGFQITVQFDFGCVERLLRRGGGAAIEVCGKRQRQKGEPLQQGEPPRKGEPLQKR